MFKKIASLAIAATMMVGTAAITASAAEVEADTVGAEDSAVVSADSSSEVGADSASEAVSAGTVVKFDAKKSGWNLDTNKKFYCHIWKADGSGSWPEWQTKAEQCTFDKDTGIATYDLSKTGNTISPSDGRIYCVIFSSNTGMQTCNVIMSGACIGDTLYCTGEQSENPEDSEKKDYVAKWENTADCGQERKITSTGNIVGAAFPEGESDVTLLATYLMAYYDDPAKTELTQNLLDTLKVSPTDVISVVKQRVTDDDKKVNAIVDILSKCTDPTTGKQVNKDDLNKAQAGNPGSSSGGSSTGSSSTGSSSSSGSGSSSVKSGVETTILFVFGGLMLAAAGVAFLARKKREE
ncbi:MAG: LPXTG cell wall anchor domain-containing protein [Ruminococcus sp.]